MAPAKPALEQRDSRFTCRHLRARDSAAQLLHVMNPDLHVMNRICTS